MAHFGTFFWDADVKNGGIAPKPRMQHSCDLCLLCVSSFEQKGEKLSSAGDSQTMRVLYMGVWVVRNRQTAWKGTLFNTSSMHPREGLVEQ